MVNTAGGSAFAVYRKSDGSLVAGPTMLGDLRAAGGPCVSGYGDGIVLFDTLASRWLMAEFAAVGNHLCVYVSRTSDPLAGGWFSYDFPRDIAPDARRGHDRARERRDGRRGAAGGADRLPPEAGRVRGPARQSGASARVPAARLQLALRKGRDLPEPQRQYLLHIERTCREMMRLIQNLLEISKIEEGKMPVAREPIVLAEMVDEVAREYGPVAEQAGRRLRIAVGTDLPPASGDRALLKRVLVNLVVNALRHSGSSEVVIEGGSAPPDVRLEVVDYGHGIAEGDRVRIFEKFRTVRRSPSDDPGGDTGLGLPFCKLAVERMGGRISLASSPGLNTVFTVTLPSART